MNNPSSGTPTYTFIPNSELCFEYNPRYSYYTTDHRTNILAIESEPYRRTDIVDGYTWWNSIHIPLSSYLVDEAASTQPTKTITKSTVFTSMLSIQTYNMYNLKVYFELQFSGDVMLFRYGRDCIHYGSGNYGWFVIWFTNPTTLSVVYGAPGVSMTTRTFPVSPNVTTNTLQLAMYQGISQGFSTAIGLNNTWIFPVSAPAVPWSGYRTLAYRHFVVNGSVPTPANPLTITLKTKSTEFTYAPPAGYVGLDDFVT